MSLNKLALRIAGSHLAQLLMSHSQRAKRAIGQFDKWRRLRQCQSLLAKFRESATWAIMKSCVICSLWGCGTKDDQISTYSTPSQKIASLLGVIQYLQNLQVSQVCLDGKSSLFKEMQLCCRSGTCY